MVVVGGLLGVGIKIKKKLKYFLKIIFKKKYDGGGGEGYGVE